jgi:hypothetical protein
MDVPASPQYLVRAPEFSAAWIVEAWQRCAIAVLSIFVLVRAKTSRGSGDRAEQFRRANQSNLYGTMTDACDFEEPRAATWQFSYS